MRVTKKCFLCGVACALLTVMLLGLAACEKAPEVQIAEPSVTTKTTEPPVFIEPDLPEREINIKNYNVIGQWENTRVTANGEDSSYGPFRSQDFNTFTKWNPQAKPGYSGDPGIAAFASILFSVYISLWAVVISLWTAFGSLIICSISGMAASVLYIFEGHGIICLAYMGESLVCMGIAIFMFFGCKAATKGTVLLLKNLLLWIKGKFIKKEEYHE